MSFLTLVQTAPSESPATGGMEEAEWVGKQGWRQSLSKAGLTTWKPGSCPRPERLAPFFISVLYQYIETHTNTHRAPDLQTDDTLNVCWSLSFNIRIHFSLRRVINDGLVPRQLQMPIYSLKYLNTSTVELNHHLYTAWGACILRATLGCQNTHILYLTRRNRDSLGIGVLSWPLLGPGSQQHLSVYIGHSYIMF